MKEYKITEQEIKEIRELARLENDIEINIILDDVVARERRGANKNACKHT